MKIAIIGGGAAGMSTAYLLNKIHDLTIFEKQSVLGGNIRTLNKNIKNLNIDSRLTLDCGVIEFQRQNFPCFQKLMKDLKVPLQQIYPSSTLFLANGTYYKSGAGILSHCNTFGELIHEIYKVAPLFKSYLSFLMKASHQKHQDLYDKPVSDFLKNDLGSMWLKMLLMYAYSIPFHRLNNFPAELALPLLSRSHIFTKWDSIPGGVYSYIEKILQIFEGRIFCDARIKTVTRTKQGVNIKLESGELLDFDKVIFAVTPDQVLKLLCDASEIEKRSFKDWTENHIETVIHTDTSFYKKFKVTEFSEFDVFQNNNIERCGYNAYLNRLYNINQPNDKFARSKLEPEDPSQKIHYSLAYNLDQVIDSQRIIHRQRHESPNYTVKALHFRKELIAQNGQNHTFYVGAYLGEGLHEGAISSAVRVSKMLGGKLLNNDDAK